MATVLHSAPRFASNEGVKDALAAALGDMVLATNEEHGEIVLGVERERIEDALRLLRDEHEYQQLMEIAGVDYPTRAERFDVVYMLLSLTKNHRVMVKVRAAEDTPVPTVTTLWPNAGWLEREVFDLEAAFLFPWAVSLDVTGWPGWITMMVFLFELAVGLAYAWKKGALEWE